MHLLGLVYMCTIVNERGAGAPYRSSCVETIEDFDVRFRPTCF